jgi:hypothetical protein
MAVQRVMGISFSKVQKRCNFVSMAKANKKRASKYDEKLAINASFDEIIKVSATPYKPKAKKEQKTNNKKK